MRRCTGVLSIDIRLKSTDPLRCLCRTRASWTRFTHKHACMQISCTLTNSLWVCVTLVVVWLSRVIFTVEREQSEECRTKETPVRFISVSFCLSPGRRRGCERRFVLWSAAVPLPRPPSLPLSAFLHNGYNKKKNYQQKTSAAASSNRTRPLFVHISWPLVGLKAFKSLPLSKNKQCSRHMTTEHK